MEPHLIRWSDLIQEALIYILSMLDFDSLVAASRVCRSWRAAALFPECCDSIHVSLHHSFLDHFIKGGTGAVGLEKLNLKSLHLLTHGGARTKSICIDSIASDAMLRRIACRFPSMESLSLRSCNGISNSSFCNLIHACKKLKFVDISYCSSTTPKTIEVMGRCCPSLVGLNLAHLQLTEETAIAIGEFVPNLKWLNLNNTLVTNNGLCSILQSCSELQYLSVMWCPRLDLNQELMDMTMSIAEFKYDHSMDDYLDCDVSYFEKWLLQWFP